MSEPVTAGQGAMVIGFADYQPQAQRLADAMGLPYRGVDLHRFPDGEARVRLPAEMPARCIFCRSLDRPDGKLVELLLAAAGARTLGAERITLVAPYLCYMRQDTAFSPGEVISQKVIGKLLAGYFDAVVTVDAHLHRVHSLSQAVPARQAINLTAAPLMADFIGNQLDDPYLLGPDAESEQWVKAIASRRQLNFGVARKQRHGDRDVSISLPRSVVGGRHVVVVDDVASTGRTLLETVGMLEKLEPESISVLVTHALFVDQADLQLRRAGVSNVWSCDSIAHPSNRIELAGMLGEALNDQVIR